MIRRLVNGFVHDLRPLQLHMFLSEADRIVTSAIADRSEGLLFLFFVFVFFFFFFFQFFSLIHFSSFFLFFSYFH